MKRTAAARKKAIAGRRWAAGAAAGNSRHPLSLDYVTLVHDLYDFAGKSFLNHMIEK
jgi:hypothetical protein